MKKETNILKGINKKILIITIVVAIITIIIATIISKAKKQANKITQMAENSQTQTNEEVKPADKQIAKILFEAYFEGEIDETQISEAGYDSERERFSCTYITKQFEEPYKRNEVTISTDDFVSYHYAEVEYIYKEEAGMDVPFNDNGTLRTLINDKKNEIIELAKKEGYNTGNNLSNEQFAILFQKIFQKDENLQQIIQQNDYILKCYGEYEPNKVIEFTYVQRNNEKNRIKITSFVNSVENWEVRGTSDTPVYEGEEYKDYLEEYIFEYDITIQDERGELQEIHNKMNEQININR